MIKSLSVITELKHAADTQKAQNLSRFFKTGKGQYGEGDIFWGIAVPTQHTIAKKYVSLPLTQVEELINSPVHECRLTGLLLLVYKFKKADENLRKELYMFYLKHSEKVNNWDLVDTSAKIVVGEYLLDRDTTILEEYARSKNMWQRRIAILSTAAFIKRDRFDETIKIATILLHDEHDLIHKAVGWMLREVGKRDLEVLLNFLDKHAQTMPRTMLRYAIEKLHPEKKEYFMKLKTTPY